MLERIDVAVLPSEASAIAADCFIVVDQLRATSTIAVLFSRGLTSLAVVDDLDRARSMAREMGAILFGEQGGLPPVGFDYGNSPVEASGLALAGRRAVLFTTNGTTALCAVAGQGHVYTGALANASAVAAYVTPRYRHVAIVCAGNARARTFSLEDFAAAGAIVRHLAALAPGARTGDAAALAASLPVERIGEGEHAGALRAIGLDADIAFCTTEDTAPVVPRVVSSSPGLATLERTA
jgi:2-phosphosulfolactate phosphatase